MPVVAYETRRQPPLLVRVLAFGVINMLGIWIAGAFDWLSFDDSFWTLLFAGLLLAFFNILIKPMMMLLSLPFIIVTFGLFIAVVNAFMLWITSIFIPALRFGQLLEHDRRGDHSFDRQPAARWDDARLRREAEDRALRSSLALGSRAASGKSTILIAERQFRAGVAGQQHEHCRRDCQHRNQA